MKLWLLFWHYVEAGLLSTEINILQVNQKSGSGNRVIIGRVIFFLPKFVYKTRASKACSWECIYPF